MYVPSCLEITVDYSFAWEQTQLAISHAFLTRMGSQQVVVTPDVLLLCQSKLHLMGKSALVSWRKIFFQWENMHIHALQGCWVWVCSTGMSSLTALLLSPNLETIVPGPIFNECPFGRANGICQKPRNFLQEHSSLSKYLLGWGRIYRYGQ